MFYTWRMWLPYFVLLAIGVPWYWRPLWGDDETLWLGMPAWTVTAIAASFATSCYTAWILHWRWPAELDDNSADDGSSEETP